MKLMKRTKIYLKYFDRKFYNLLNINIDKARKSRRIFKNRRWRYIMNKRKVQFI